MEIRNAQVRLLTRDYAKHAYRVLKLLPLEGRTLVLWRHYHLLSGQNDSIWHNHLMWLLYLLARDEYCRLHPGRQFLVWSSAYEPAEGQLHTWTMPVGP